MSGAESFDAAEGVAIIGMAGRFPGARNLEEFWHNLRDGVESISFFNDEELAAEGVEPELSGSERYVRARGVLADIEWFDAAFFGLSPREAEITDPQHRLFLECAWEALEAAGYDARQEQARVGVFGGCATNTYLVNIYSHPELLAVLEPLQISIGNDKDYLTTRVSYKLNLKGPSLTVQSACSTSLVAVHLACRSLLGYQCDVALAGGAKIIIPQRTGYTYQEGGMNSPDGHCRAFDAGARGTVGGNGVGVVVLKRLEDALADGDQIHAVIRGSAVNNDGSLKVGYTAPSVEGQSEAVAEALAVAGVEAESIGYIETHGTGTPLGDPIEIAALTKAFRAGTKRDNFCAVGSVKTNVGHLDAASGMAGLFKTVLALKHKSIPPSLHFAEANPQIDFPSSPFFVNTRLNDWRRADTPRRAGVNAYSIGGTNAHVILEEAPPREPSEESRQTHQLLVVSAHTRTALDAATRNLRAHLDAHPQLDLADVAYTLQVGRRAFEERRVLVCRDRDDALLALEAPDAARVFDATSTGKTPPLVLLFPGEFEPHPRACAELYTREPAFRREFERCSELLRASLSFDLRELVSTGGAEARRRLREPRVARAAAFVFAHALARLWMEWGVVPAASFGEGVGEYAAVCARGEADVEEVLKRLARANDLPLSRLDRAALEEFLQRPGSILLELGAGRMTRELVARRRSEGAEPLMLSCFSIEDSQAHGADSNDDDSVALLSALGRMWLAGVRIDWKRFHAPERRQRVSLPTYPFERRFFWVDLPHAPEEVREATPEPHARASYARGSLKAEYAAPRSELEHELVRIWQEVIGVAPIGINDDFFELGGDSVMSLQIIARAHQVALRLTPREVFERPTIAELAASADLSAATHAPATAATEDARATVTGPVPLTPIQSWFFEEEFAEPHYFNQSVLLEVRETLDPALVERSVRALLVHHDALRLRFTRGATGWRQFNAGADNVDDTPFTQLDFSELPPGAHERLIEDASRRLQASLNLSSGPLLRVALYQLGAGRAARLLLSIHHLAVDAVSWRILLEDLQTAYNQLSRGEPVRLPAKSTSFKRWAERLTEHAWSEEMRREADYWCDSRWELPAPVPLDVPEGVNSEASADTLSVSLDEEETSLL
ncbi:MAG: type I polyketide synthase, partial [Pyrinomonadaceae bacterium]